MNKRSIPVFIKAPVLVTVILIGFFLSLLINNNKKQESVDQALIERRAIVLSPDCDKRLLSEIIYNNGYAETKSDANFIAQILVDRQQKYGRLNNLYMLQKREHGQISANIADSCNVLTSILRKSCEKIGQNEPLFLYDSDTLHAGNGKIIVNVSKIEKTRLTTKTLPCENVPVRLQIHYRDSLNKACSFILGYVTTNAEGVAEFDGLDTEKSYSVLPVLKGFEYGSSQGTRNGIWNTDQKTGAMMLHFTQQEHRIRFFDDSILKQIKNEQTILVRSPQEYHKTMVTWFVLVLVLWWMLVLYMLYKKNSHGIILISAAMFLTTMCVLIMFSIQNSLNDELLGVVMGWGVVIGIGIMGMFQRIDFIKLYQKKDGYDIPLKIFCWLFKPFKQKISRLTAILKSDASILKKMWALLRVIIAFFIFIWLEFLPLKKISEWLDKICEKLPKGVGWLISAILLTLMLFIFGEEVGGSTVNLNIFNSLRFQPSEIVKYLVLLFAAAYFTQQTDSIIAYSREYSIKKTWVKVRTLTWLILGLAILMGLYIWFSDMGPALVLGTTFILLYSLIKSKVYLEKLDASTKWTRIFTCDFAMLIYGVLSFAAFLIVGRILGIILVFGVLWFVFWIAFGYLAFSQQLFESAIFLNIIIFIFIISGNAGDIPYFKNTHIAERLEARTSMCVNTWGNLDIEHDGLLATPVSNTQVANGLWALASGGFYGQGLGNGKPSVTPAFHTDMILSSIGEQLGGLGLLLIVLSLYILLRRMVLIGYYVGHPFAFYLCLGFAIATSVQFFIIALGSTGVIPLTGVTVPFLSYGRVSMIVNLAALGIVISLSKNINATDTIVSDSVRHEAVESYSYPIAIVTLVFICFIAITSIVWGYYQIIKRNSTLIHPVYVINKQGAPSIEYNPRIALLIQNMYAGRIYDRHNVLLATSDRKEIDPAYYRRFGLDENAITKMKKRSLKRYYPFGNHMFFMIGDMNTGLLFSYSDSNPMGYMAEAQHLAYLRGFDNVMYDKNGNPQKIRLKTSRLKEDPYLMPRDTISDPILLRNYKPLLIYLKDGIDGNLVKKHNEQVKDNNYDLYLTIDASLQTDLQNRLAKYVERKYPNNNLMRISVVVLDAQKGDLLASANYPLPNSSRIWKEDSLAKSLGKKGAVFSDNLKSAQWFTYTDRDLGLTYQTPPGSTAKVMSAIAGLNLGHKDAKFFIERYEEIHSGEPLGRVDMKTAIVKSSNCYFINLVNKYDLYSELGRIYANVGITLNNKKSYVLEYRHADSLQRNEVMNTRNKAIPLYTKYISDKTRGVYNNYTGRSPLGKPDWMWAWGQGTMDASPLNMARVASIVVNKGKMPHTRFLLKDPRSKKDTPIEYEELTSEDNANTLKSYMKAQANGRFPSFDVGGKTGTPERTRITGYRLKYNRRTRQYTNIPVEEKINDGWYVFFVEGDETHSSIAVAVRMERGVNSGHALSITKEELLNCLNEHEYIKN